MADFDEATVRQTYSFLAHERETEVRVICPRKERPAQSLFVHSADEFANVCRAYNGQYNVYCGIHERKQSEKDANGVLRVKTFIVDIDPVRAPDTASTQAELDLCLKKAEQIVKDWQGLGFKPPVIVMSGNGAQLWFALDTIPVTDENRKGLEKRFQLLQRKFKTKYSDQFVKIDQIGDLPRIIKVIGTKSIKGQDTVDRPHRLSYAVTPFVRGNDVELTSEILKLPTEPTANGSAPPNLDFLKLALGKDKKARKLYAGDYSDYTSRSEAELALCCKLIQYGLNREQCFKALECAGLGKWKTAHEAYRDLTFNKAKEWWEANKDKIHQHRTRRDNEPITAFSVAEELMQDHHIITIIDSNDIYVYKEGVYAPHGDKILAEQIQERHAEQNRYTVSNGFVEQVLGHVKRSTYVNLRQDEAPLNLICLQNGILNVENFQIVPHTPELIFFNKIPVEYRADANCPKIQEFLAQIASEKDIVIIQELFGYCLYRKYHIQKAFMFVGEGHNGKSTLINLFRRLLGEANCSSIPLQGLTQTFSRSQIFGKLVNTFADLPKDVLGNTSFFKMFIGGDSIVAEKKGKDGFTFVNYAKMIFSANQIPLTHDQSFAFFRRWELIDFPNQFTGAKDTKGLIDKLATPEELSGLLSFAIQGLQRVLAQNDFSAYKTVDDIKEAYLRSSDNVAAFVLDCITESPDAVIEKKDIYAAYSAYCRKMRYGAAEFEAEFFKRFRNLVPVTDARPRSGGSRLTCLRGIEISGMDEVVRAVKGRPHSIQDLNEFPFVEAEQKTNTPKQPLDINLPLTTLTKTANNNNLGGENLTEKVALETEVENASIGESDKIPTTPPFSLRYDSALEVLRDRSDRHKRGELPDPAIALPAFLQVWGVDVEEKLRKEGAIFEQPAGMVRLL